MEYDDTQWKDGGLLDMRRVKLSIKFGNGGRCMFDSSKIKATINPPSQFLFPLTTCYVGKNCDGRSNCELKSCVGDYVCQVISKYRKEQVETYSECTAPSELACPFEMSKLSNCVRSKHGRECRCCCLTPKCNQGQRCSKQTL